MAEGPSVRDRKDRGEEEPDKALSQEENADLEDDEGDPLPDLDTLPRNPWMMIAIIGGVLGVIFAGWFFLSSSDASRGGGRLIRADTGPIKTRPDDPGGMQFPHQDKLVYNEVGGETASQLETLGPEPEQPMARPEPETLSAPVSEPALALAVETPQRTYVESGPVKDFTPELDPVPLESSAYSVLSTEPSYPVASRYDWDNSFVLQLGAFSSRDLAEKAWKIYVEGNEDVLAAAGPNVLAKMTTSGLRVYALRSGPFRTREDATIVLDVLKDRGIDSFVVAP